jgi:hypothetical protein
MPTEGEALITEYLRRQPVLRSVTNVKTEELGIRNYRQVMTWGRGNRIPRDLA